ncbi:hypothetical protein DIPPA_64142, partial [Diplonema papillatum]
MGNDTLADRDTLTQRTLALWEEELHGREEELKQMTREPKPVPCGCDGAKLSKEVLGEIVMLKREEERLIARWLSGERSCAREREIVCMREQRARDIEDYLRQREEAVNARERAVLERELRLKEQELALQRERDTLRH